MHRKIYKYPLENIIDQRQAVLLPTGARILSFRMQNDVPVIWAAVIDGYGMEYEAFVLRYTGSTTDLRESFPYDAGIIYGSEYYIGTDIDSHGLVYHLFSIVK